ncbi:MAG: CRISPR-associated protein Csx11 [Actinomycetota bacterium]
MTKSLEILAQNRNALLLAETASWLHDYRKCSDEHIAAQASPKPNGIQGLNKALIKDWLPDPKPSINFLQSNISLDELIILGGSREGFNPSQPWVVRALRRCHYAAHIEKEKEKSDQTGKQSVNDTRPATPFGLEGEPLSGLTARLKALPYKSIDKRGVFLGAIQSTFAAALGDTRRPANEVTLWDWSHIVAALYKAALAYVLLTGDEPVPNNLRWRLLALRFNGSQIVDRSPNIQALLARRKWISDGLNNVKHLLEEEYPLGTEVYRDSNGSLFVVPDIEDILDYQDSNGCKLSCLIQQRLGFDGELKVTPTLDLSGWWAQDPQGQGNDEIPPIAEWLAKNNPANPDLDKLKEWWQGATNVEPCCISDIRPQGPSPKGIERKISDYWLERVGNRSKEWASKLETTIWIDEVADINGRVALIAAKLELQDWLKPNGLVKTLLVKRPQSGQAVVKTPSFARLRRIWETCERFWEESVEGQVASLVGSVGPRLIIKGDLYESEKLDAKKLDSLDYYRAYEIPFGSVNMEVVWDEGKKRLIVATNLQYLAKRLGAKPDECDTLENAVQWLQRNHLKDGSDLNILEPKTSATGKPVPVGHIRNITVKAEQHNYTPAIPILTEPKQFMVLVPANKALEVVQYIKAEYEVQFSRVKNRLPLHLNVVFFNRKQPLYAAIDAARRMLVRESSINTDWIVEEVGEADGQDVCNHSDGRLGNRVRKLRLMHKEGKENLVSTEMLQMNNKLKTFVSYSTGDPNTEDIWYPYFFIKKAGKNAKPIDRRNLYFKALLPGSGGNNEFNLVHVKEIEVGDEVCYAPSTFDFEFLDVTARRFELSYDGASGMRLPKAGESYSTRPFLLEDLDIIQRLWKLVAEDESTAITTTQLRQITEAIETKRQDWQITAPDDDALYRFAEQTFQRSFDKRWNKIPVDQREQLVSWATSGRWRDIIELEMQILKKQSLAAKASQVK